MDILYLEDLLQQARTAQQRQSYDEAILSYDRLIEATLPPYPHLDVQEIRLFALQERSELLGLIGNLPAFIEGLQNYYLEAGSSQHAVKALVLLAERHSKIGNDKQAMSALEEALNISEALNYTYGRARAFAGIGLALYNLNQTEEAISPLLKGLALFEQLGDREWQMRCYSRLGVCYLSNGILDKAIVSFEKNLTIARTLNDWSTATALSNLGECYQYLYNMERAMVYHREAIFRAERTNLHADRADLYRNFGYELCYLGKMEEGIDYLQKALQLSQESYIPDIHAQILYSLAESEWMRGNIEASEQYARQLEAHGEQNKKPGYLGQALCILGRCAQQRGNLAEAELLWQRALFLIHETGWRSLLWQTHAALGDIAGTPALAQVHYQIAADIIYQIAYPIQDKSLRETFLQAPPIQVILQKTKNSR